MKKTLPLSLAAVLALSACVSTAPKVGDPDAKTVATGAAGGANASNANPELEKCASPMGTLAVVEDTNANWYQILTGQYKLPSTAALLRLLVQQSNCFVVVERGRAMNNMQQERALQQAGELRSQSNFGKGQMVSADYSLNPEVLFSERGTGGLGGAIGGFGGGAALVGAVVEATAPAAPAEPAYIPRARVQDPFPYRETVRDERGMHASFFRDMLNARHDHNAAERFNIAQTMIQNAGVQTDVNEIIPDQYRPDMYVSQLTSLRTLIDSFSRQSIDGPNPIRVPKFSSASGLMADHVEGTNPTTGTLRAARRPSSCAK